MASSVSSIDGLADRVQLGLESQLHYMISSSDRLIPGLVHSILLYSMKKTGVELLEVWKTYQSIQRVNYSSISLEQLNLLFLLG